MKTLFSDLAQLVREHEPRQVNYLEHQYPGQQPQHLMVQDHVGMYIVFL